LEREAINAREATCGLYRDSCIFATMKAYQREFLAFAVEVGAIRFGEFVLKSGRSSPYFFNAGAFSSGCELSRLGRFYAKAILEAGIAFDMVYGPAYKGIPLAVATAIALADQYQRDVPYAFKRKEAKGHGEGGLIVGAPLHGRVFIIDDAISAGTSVAEAVETITDAGAAPAGVAIALDRQERGSAECSAVQEVERDYGLAVICIANLDNLVAYLAESGASAHQLQAIAAYRQAYGA
jgi:orotate phosphoribosyltransferase